MAIVALYQGREAERQRDIAASRELAARATSFLDGDPGLSLALALEALDRQDTEQARERAAAGDARVTDAVGLAGASRLGELGRAEPPTADAS